jgi:hypothetical protein
MSRKTANRPSVEADTWVAPQPQISGNPSASGLRTFNSGNDVRARVNLHDGKRLSSHVLPEI